MTDIITEAETPTAVLPRISHPAELQQAREARGWSRLDVARQTKFQVRQVAALEEGDYAALPGRSFVRAALRNYASLLEVDVQPLLDSIGGHAEPAELTVQLRNSEAARVAEMGAEYEPARRSRASRILWGLGGLIAVAVLWAHVGWGASLASAEGWFNSLFGGKQAESRVVDRQGGKVTETFTWSWPSADGDDKTPAASNSNPTDP